MNKSYIKFVNHASVIISNGNKGVLSDPWYFDSAFHNGWSLFHENTIDEILNILDEIDFIWISHEHPDHFSVPFYMNQEVKKKINQNKIKIIFQNTKDKRVVSFLKKNNYEVIELKTDEKFVVDNDFTLSIFQSHFYDSALILNIDNKKIINLNDCPIEDKDELNVISKKYGSFDILLTQFSYAAWKGGRENKKWRVEAAKEKVQAVVNQCSALNVKKLIPFASYIYFSNELNFYLNDSVNTPQNIVNKLSQLNCETIVMKPLEKQDLNLLKQDKSSLDFWEEKYDNINKLNKIKFDKTFSIDELNKNFVNYKNRIFEKNSKLFIYFVSLFKFMRIFSKINIYLIDHQKNIEYSIFSGLKITDDKSQDISLHSSSLNFIFQNEFGFDTLTVNGCFESSQVGFSKVAKNFAIGSLNTLGIKFNFF